MRYFLLILVFSCCSCSVSDNNPAFSEANQGKGTNLFPLGFNAHLNAIPTPKKEVDINALEQSNWYAEALKGIEEMEYEIKYDPATHSYASPNRKNKLKSFYTANYFILLPLNDSADNWKLDLNTTGIFANDQLVYKPQSAATITQLPSSIQFNHNHQFITEYINTEEGVRQNFIIQKDPFAQQDLQYVKDDKSNRDGHKKNTITVKLGVNKNWIINQVHPSEVHFAKAEKTGYNRKITYNGLKVWDAANNSLAAHFEVINNELQIQVDAANAVYPITIDPLSTGTAGTPDSFLNPTNVSSAQAGISVAGAGDVNGDGYSDVIIGASGFQDGGNFAEGRAFVYHGSATGLSATPNSTLDEADQIGAQFGWSVAGAGDVNGDGYSDVIIGALNYDDGANTDEGRAYVYYGSSTGLSNTPNNIYDDANQANAQFGYSVAGAGDVNGDGYSDVIIGSPRYVGSSGNDGRAFVYYGSASGLSATPNSILDGANQGGTQFGCSVAGAGDVNGDGYSDVIIGAYLYNDGFNIDEGRAFVYYGSATGLSATPNSTPDDADLADAWFGYSVSGAGDVNGDGYSDVIIGARNYDDGGNTAEGRAFVYYGSVTGLSTTPNSVLDDANQANALYGISVAGAGDVNGDGYSDVIIGARGYNDGGNAFEGRAFVHYGSVTGLSATPNSILDDANQTNAQFGNSVASAGDVNGDGYSDVIIGAPNSGNAGRAFVYHGSAAGLSASPNNTPDDADQIGARFASSVASAGDVNGDGYSDVIIGAITFDDGANTDEGRAFVYHGSATGLSATPNSTLDDADQANAQFGNSVAGAGDVNGDGYGDVIVSAMLYDDGSNTDEGRAFIYYGSAAGLSASPNSTPDDANQVSARFGSSVAGAGDVNADGFSDIIIGAYLYDDGSNADEGRAFVYYGGAIGISATPNIILDDADQVSTGFGISVAGAGDVNGDAYSDVIIGAFLYDDGGNADEGRAFVYYGSATGLSATPNSTPDDADQAGAQFGNSVSSAGDVNGDGYSDVIIGAQVYDDGGNTNEGRAFVYYGSVTGLSATPNSTLDDADLANAQFGSRVSSAGDVNGDGYSDVIIGAQFFADGANTNEGRAFVYYGSVSGLSAAPNSTPDDADQIGARFGISVAGAGDVNGDGYSDVIVGALSYDDVASADEGRAFVYNGNEATGVNGKLRLYNSDLITPIMQSNAADFYFGTGLFAKSPQGRVKARLVWETKPKGQAFNGNPITNSTSFQDKQTNFSNIGVTGIELKSVILKNLPQTKIRARIEYDKATSITGQVYGPWRYPQEYLRGALGMNAVPLPLSLISFNAQIISNTQQQLNWIADNEDGIIHYIVERSSNGANFVSIGTVNASAAGQRNVYSFIDNDPFAGVVYYRLQIVEQDGSKTYSKIVVLNNTQQYAATIFPSPVVQGNSVTVKIIGLRQNNKVSIRVFNTEGKQLYSSNQFTSPGQNTFSLNTNNLSKGVYWVRIMIDNKEKTHKLVVQ